MPAASADCVRFDVASGTRRKLLHWRRHSIFVLYGVCELLKGVELICVCQLPEICDSKVIRIVNSSGLAKHDWTGVKVVQEFCSTGEFHGQGWFITGPTLPHVCLSALLSGHQGDTATHEHSRLLSQLLSPLQLTTSTNSFFYYRKGLVKCSGTDVLLRRVGSCSVCSGITMSQLKYKRSGVEPVLNWLCKLP